MILTVNNYLNARYGKASVNSPVYKIMEPGSTIEADRALIGDLVSASSIWFHNSVDNCFYWSGGIATVEFDVNGQTTSALNDNEALQVLSEAKSYFWTKYALTGLNGISVVNTDGFKLSFRFQSNETLPEGFGAALSFKGFVIPTIVSVIQPGRFSMPPPNFISDSISAIQQNEIGTAGIKLKGTRPNDKNSYLLTNYHVAAFAPLLNQRYTYPYEGAEQIDCVMPAWAVSQSADSKIGKLSKGLFNDWHDVALILLDDPNSVSNTTLDGTVVNKSIDIFKQAAYYHKDITLFGYLNNGVTGKILSVNASQNFTYNGIDYKKDDLIQIEHISQEGDSGGAVLYNGLLIGILLGDDNDSSYVLPIQRILNSFHLSL